MFIRAKLAKGKEAMFISHLDYIRAVERAMRRAELPLVYSEGFSPRPRISYGPPLSVGMTSEAEFIDVEIYCEIYVDHFIHVLNKFFPPGLSVLDACAGLRKPASLTSIINTEDYIVGIDAANVDIDIEKEIANLAARENIRVLRRSPKGEKEIDIKPFLKEIKLIAKQNHFFTVFFRTATGPKGNFRPKDLLAIWPAVNIFKQHRRSLWMEKGGSLHDPLVTWEEK